MPSYVWLKDQNRVLTVSGSTGFKSFVFGPTSQVQRHHRRVVSGPGPPQDGRPGTPAPSLETVVSSIHALERSFVINISSNLLPLLGFSQPFGKGAMRECFRTYVMMSLFIHQASSRGYCPSAPVTEASDLDKQQHFSHPDHVMVQVHIPHIFLAPTLEDICSDLQPKMVLGTKPQWTSSTV